MNDRIGKYSIKELLCDNDNIYTSPDYKYPTIRKTKAQFTNLIWKSRKRNKNIAPKIEQISRNLHLNSPTHPIKNEILLTLTIYQKYQESIIHKKFLQDSGLLK